MNLEKSDTGCQIVGACFPELRVFSKYCIEITKRRSKVNHGFSRQRKTLCTLSPRSLEQDNLLVIGIARVRMQALAKQRYGKSKPLMRRAISVPAILYRSIL